MSNVLIVEDDPIARSIMEKILSKHGYHVTSTSNALDGLDMLDEYIDLAIVDIGLPDMRGDELVMEIRKKYSREKLPICFASSYSDKEVILKAISKGGSDYIVKPIDPEIFINKINKLAGKKSTSITFNTLNVKYRCNLLDDNILSPRLTITEVSESGLTIHSNVAFKKDGQFFLECHEFSEKLEIDIEDLRLRVSECQVQMNKYEITTEFVGLNESTYQKIRAFVIKGCLAA